MNGPRRAIVVGLAMAGLYVLAAAGSGRLSPLARRPLLDGLAPPPPYRWVSPPPALASSNQRPSAGRFTISLDPQTGSEANVFSTADAQAAIALREGAIPPRHGDTSVTLVVTPLAPGRPSVIPAGFQIAGNVYRFDATYRPSGAPVGPLTKTGQAIFVYPLDAHVIERRLLVSKDGRAWTAVPTMDHVAQQVVQADFDQLGYFAVGEHSTATPAPSGSGGFAVYLVVGGAVLATLLIILVIALRRRPRPPSTRPTPRRRPSSRDRSDPWD